MGHDAHPGAGSDARRAVQARAGDRARYAPVESALIPGHARRPRRPHPGLPRRPGRTRVLCRRSRRDRGRRNPARSAPPAWRAPAAPCGLMVDAAVSRPGRRAERPGVGRRPVVVGLETLRTFGGPRRHRRAAAPERVVFSLDLRLGRPMLHPANREAAGADARTDIAERAVAAGARDAAGARCGSGRNRLRGGSEAAGGAPPAVPSERLLAGGGVGGRRDLDRIRDAGCDGVLMATALHAGRVGAADVLALAAPAPAQSSASTSR